MEIATILGYALAFASLAFTVTASGGDVWAYVNPPSLACVFGGTFATLLISFPLQTAAQLGPGVWAALFRRPADRRRIVDALVQLSVTARRRGLLALEPELAGLRDPLAAAGLRLTVDGAQPDAIESVMRAEVNEAAERRAVQRGLLEHLGRHAPAFGMIGTLLGLVLMLGRMTDAEAIGPGMAVALLTTLYGVVFANGICLPMAGKLGYLAKHEAANGEVVIQGVLAIQAGEHPRMIREKLAAHLPPKLRRPSLRAA